MREELKKMPKIVSAAIKIYPIDNDNYPIILTAKRHCDIYEYLHNYHIIFDKTNCTEGFITNADQFVDRYEAAAMAYDYGQIDKELTILYSEDLW